MTIIGEKFGRWLVKSLANPYVWVSKCGTKKQTHPQYNCVCECGKEKIVRFTNLQSGKSVSCGCFSVETSKLKATKHDMVGTREHNAWIEMKRRCYTASCKSYKYYGGRGIKIQEDWVNSFASFYNHMGVCPTGYTLERINVEKDYEEGNVIWADYSTQVKNRRKLNGVSKYKYVHFNKKNSKWYVLLLLGDKRENLGNFEDEEKAAIFAYRKYFELYNEWPKCVEEDLEYLGLLIKE